LGQAWDWLRLKLSDPLWQGAVMAATISLLRVLYEGKEANKWRVILEALICGALSLSASSSVIEWMAWPSSLSIAAGGTIGVTAIRELIIRFLGRKADRYEGFRSGTAHRAGRRASGGRSTKPRGRFAR
jgi:lambda family phage holin